MLEEHLNHLIAYLRVGGDPLPHHLLKSFRAPLQVVNYPESLDHRLAALKISAKACTHHGVQRRIHLLEPPRACVGDDQPVVALRVFPGTFVSLQLLEEELRGFQVIAERTSAEHRVPSEEDRPQPQDHLSCVKGVFRSSEESRVRTGVDEMLERVVVRGDPSPLPKLENELLGLLVSTCKSQSGKHCVVHCEIGLHAPVQYMPVHRNRPLNISRLGVPCNEQSISFQARRNGAVPQLLEARNRSLHVSYLCVGADHRIVRLQRRPEATVFHHLPLNFTCVVKLPGVGVRPDQDAVAVGVWFETSLGHFVPERLARQDISSSSVAIHVPVVAFNRWIHAAPAHRLPCPWRIVQVVGLCVAIENDFVTLNVGFDLSILHLDLKGPRQAREAQLTAVGPGSNDVVVHVHGWDGFSRLHPLQGGCGTLHVVSQNASMD
mmetsp:Transcript_36781/g.147113  ORF Transcript_36781/g.147113 Transcript_36781/m.147113 type:complete len:435 (-) Transcript_36781:1101-2405(-)